MAAVLQRELDAYADAIDKYNRQARQYKTDATSYNEKVDAYNEFVKAKTAGNYSDYDTNVFYAENKGRFLVRSDLMVDVPTSQLGNYYVRHLGSNKYVLKPKQEGDMRAPGEFNTPQPTQPGAAPTATVGQMRRLDEPSLVDVERAGDKGLINNAFKY